MLKQTHLLKRRGSNSYYLRCRVLLDLLQHYHPTKEIWPRVHQSQGDLYIEEIEVKGYPDAAARKKLEAIKKQHPGLDCGFISGWEQKSEA
ncbi:hypothetical protein [Desulfonatronum thiosulfatophilum]|uniref:hypothetical protein n=1 Tax=Desulfonatronum thiosulfatophilum TaxID=617002 RepID=UPI000B831908|nr:hypothetical protein [Desulfonatronum thiosulfatophilum]